MSGILAEVGNIMLNSVLGAIANMIGTHVEYSVPQFCGADLWVCCCRNGRSIIGHCHGRRGVFGSPV